MINRRLTTIILFFFISFVASLVSMGQKKITPVDSDPEKPQQPYLHYYDKHGNPLDEPVLFLADLDTVTNVRPGPVYPLLYSATVGVNFFDGVMMLFGQKHASYDVSASLSLHNWFEPVIECGIGIADNAPADGNFRYKGKPSFYGKIGINYNFLYKSNPDYQVYLALRGGYTSFSYDITDITINSDYWHQSNKFELLNQKSSAFFGQVGAGIKVKIWKGISLGWSLRYGFKFNSKDAQHSVPWFIPGYGTTSLSATFSLLYTIPINTRRRDALDMLKENIGPGVPPPTGSAVAVPPSPEREPLIEVEE